MNALVAFGPGYKVEPAGTIVAKNDDHENELGEIPDTRDTVLELPALLDLFDDFGDLLVAEEDEELDPGVVDVELDHELDGGDEFDEELVFDVLLEDFGSVGDEESLFEVGCVEIDEEYIDQKNGDRELLEKYIKLGVIAELFLDIEAEFEGSNQDLLDEDQEDENLPKIVEEGIRAEDGNFLRARLDALEKFEEAAL